MTIPRQLFTVCGGNLAKCIMTQLKTNIKIHLHYIYRCNSFSVFAEEEVVINEDTFVVIMDEYDEGGCVMAQFCKKCMRESINKCKQCNYEGPYQYYIKRHIESIHLKEILECEHCGAIYNKSKK